MYNLVSCLSACSAVIFFIVIVDMLYNIVNGIRIHFTSPEVNLKQKFGDWAVVTGCTEGIGHAYAHELARRGINIVLISLNLEEVKATAIQIASLYNVRTKYIAVDLSQGKTSIEAIRSQLGNEEIAILVNNVGALTTYPKYFHECTEKELWDQVNLNVCMTTLLTHLLLPNMRKRRQGAVVNMSSMSEVFPWGLLNVYSATKVFVKYFTEGLQQEYCNSGISFQKLAPGFVSTNLTAFCNKDPRSKFVATDPETFARSAVRTLGLTNSTAGYWKHGIQTYFLNRIPSVLLKPMGVFLCNCGRRIYFAQENLLDKELLSD